MEIKRFTTFLWPIFALGTLAGCASIISGGDQALQISSTPPGAQVKIYDYQGAIIFNQQTTPFKALLKRSAGYFRSQQYKLVIEKEGYRTKEVEIKSKLNGWYIGNILLGGLIGMLIVDPATGAMWTLNPQEVNVELEGKQAFLKQKEGLLIVLKENVPQNLIEKMKPIVLSN